MKFNPQRKEPPARKRPCEICYTEHTIHYCRECGVVHRRICHACFVERRKPKALCPACKEIYNKKTLAYCTTCMMCAKHCRCYE